MRQHFNVYPFLIYNSTTELYYMLLNYLLSKSGKASPVLIKMSPLLRKLSNDYCMTTYNGWLRLMNHIPPAILPFSSYRYQWMAESSVSTHRSISSSPSSPPYLPFSNFWHIIVRRRGSALFNHLHEMAERRNVISYQSVLNSPSIPSSNFFRQPTSSDRRCAPLTSVA